MDKTVPFVLSTKYITRFLMRNPSLKPSLYLVSRKRLGQGRPVPVAFQLFLTSLDIIKL